MANKAQAEKEQLEALLNEECDAKFLRRELIVINNILSSLQYKLGDAKVVLNIIDKITPHAAVLSNIPKPAKPGEPVNLGQRAEEAQKAAEQVSLTGVPSGKESLN